MGFDPNTSTSCRVSLTKKLLTRLPIEGFRNFFLTPLVSQQYQIPTCVLECIRDFSDKLMNLRALNMPSSIY